MKRGSPERLTGQIIPDKLLPGFGLTTHTTHITHCFRRTYHAIPRIPRISRTISVGHFCTTVEAKYPHKL